MKSLIRVMSILALLLIVPQINATIHNISVGNFFFSPLKTTVQSGDTVRWNFTSAIQHTTTALVASPKAWDSGLMGSGGSFDVVFEAADGPGPFPYVCSVHPFSMIDTIFVSLPAADPILFAFLLDESQAAACAGTGSSAKGWGLAVLNADSTTLSLHVEHDVATANAAHIHNAAACADGGIAFPFASSVSPIIETFSLSPTDVADLCAGDFYVNIHSTTFPGGEIRGQIVQYPIRTIFRIDEAQAAAGGGTASTSSGLGVGELSADGTQFDLQVDHDVPILNIVDGHIHLGSPGVSGAIQHPFSSLTSPIIETWALDTNDVKNLLRGDLYVNLHTVGFPGGEIRGQIVRQPIRWVFPLTEGEAAAGAGTSSLAMGFGIVELTEDLQGIVVLCEHDVVSPIDAHIHLGAPGVAGSIVFPFTSPVSPISETFNISSSEVDDLLAGNFYVNIHSTPFPGGEIRGQIDHNSVSISALVDEAQAAVCAGTGSAATGLCNVTIKPGGIEMIISCTHDVGSTIDGHIHLGAPCVSGGIEFAFATGLSPINETWYTTQTDLENLMRGDLYVNIHSTGFPGGEIRGQLINSSCCVNRGNVDDVIGPGGPVDVSDLTNLVAFLFKGGPPPPCEEQGNVDSIVGPGGPIDVSDLTYLVAFLFKGGPPPPAC